MIEINKLLVNPNEYGIKCPIEIIPTHITIHEAAVDTVAFNLISWMRQFYSPVSFHYAVDDEFIYQGVLDNRMAFHCGDGAYGKGNNSSIGIEICCSFDYDTKRYELAKEQAAKLTANLMARYHIPIDNVVQHNYWSGEDCPKRIRAEGKWDEFIKKVKKYYKKEVSSNE